MFLKSSNGKTTCKNYSTPFFNRYAWNQFKDFEGSACLSKTSSVIALAGSTPGLLTKNWSIKFSFFLASSFTLLHKCLSSLQGPQLKSNLIHSNRTSHCIFMRHLSNRSLGWISERGFLSWSLLKYSLYLMVHNDDKCFLSFVFLTEKRFHKNLPVYRESQLSPFVGWRNKTKTYICGCVWPNKFQK